MHPFSIEKGYTPWKHQKTEFDLEVLTEFDLDGTVLPSTEEHEY